MTRLAITNRTPAFTIKFLDENGDEDDFTSGMDREASSVVINVYLDSDPTTIWNTYSMSLKAGTTATYTYLWLGNEFSAAEVGEVNIEPLVTFLNYGPRNYLSEQWEIVDTPIIEA